MTETEPVAFPQDRTCPYHPPTAYDPLRATRPLSDADLTRARNAAYQTWLNNAHTSSTIQIINNWLDFVPNDPSLADLGLPVK